MNSTKKNISCWRAGSAVGRSFSGSGQQQTIPGRSSPPCSATAVAPAQQPSLKFAILGDTGTGTKPQYEVGTKLAGLRGTFPFEFVIMLGDNMYGGRKRQGLPEQV